MAGELSSIAKLYYEELFSGLDFYFSDILPEEQSQQEIAPIEVKQRGLFMASEVLADQYPSLAELFAQTSVVERYYCLLDRFANEYRSNVDKEFSSLDDKAKDLFECIIAHGRTMPSSWDKIKSGGAAEQDWKDKMESLELRYQEDLRRCADFRKFFLSEPVLSCDADAYSRREIKDIFPALDRAYLDFNNKEIDVFVEHAPEAMYERLIVSYAVEFVAEIGSRLKNAMNDLDATRRRLEEHNNKKPDLLANVTSFGNAVETWESRRNDIIDYLDQCTGFVEKYAGVRSQLVENGASSQLAIESAEKIVRELHPDVCDAREVLMAQRWHAKRQEQEEALERQRKIDKTETGKTLDTSSEMKR